MILFTMDEISFYESALKMENLWFLKPWKLACFLAWAWGHWGFKTFISSGVKYKKILDSDVNMGIGKEGVWTLHTRKRS